LEIALKNRTILQGDVLEKLREIPDESIDCVITSPPYWGLRDYGTEGQWGLEDDFHDYLEKMRTFMHLLKMVLKPTGTVWINLGDTYSGGVTHSDFSGLPKELARPWNEGHRFKSTHKKNHIQAKSRYGIPERFYANCIDDGWLARNHIPWIKGNAMPSSVKDRFTNKWESVFFFAKEPQYYFNLDAVREKTLTETKPFNRRIQEAKKGFGQMKMGDLPGAFTQTALEDMTFNTKGERIEGLQEKLGERKMADVEGQSTQGIHRNRIDGKSDWPEWNNKQDATLGADGKPKQNYVGFNERWKNRKTCQPEANPHSINKKHSGNYDMETGICLNNPNGKNPGDVVYDKTKPYAVQEREGTIYYRNLPPLNDIIDYLNEWRNKKNISVEQLEAQFDNWTPHHWFDRKYGSYPTREDWIKTKEILEFDEKYDAQMTTLYPKNAEKQNNPNGKNPGDVFRINPRPFAAAHFATFPIDLPLKILKCACPGNGFALDPFFGAGTVGMAAEKLGLNWVGIELKNEYIEIARKRLKPYENEKII